MSDDDTGVAMNPAARPSVFTPPTAGTTIVSTVPTVDAGVATAPVSRPNTFDDLTDSVVPTTPDPGDEIAG